ncbi:unnamed protein product [Laminaria digitata]
MPYVLHSSAVLLHCCCGPPATQLTCVAAYAVPTRMSGACPFAAQWRRADEATAAARAPPETRATGTGTGTDDNNSTSTSTTTTTTAAPSSCPAGFGVAAGTCPLGFGSGTGTGNRAPSAASFASRGLPRMPLSMLAGHHHHEGGASSAGVRLVSVKGVVFDVSGDVDFAQGGRLARLPGHDASRLIALSATAKESPRGEGEGEGVGEGGGEGGGGLGVGGDLDAGLAGLRYEEHQRLETYFVEMARGRRAVAVLADADHVRIFGAPIGGGPREAPNPAPAPDQVEALSSLSLSSPLPPPPSEAALLHASVEQGDAEAVARLLRRRREADREGQPEQSGARGGGGRGGVGMAKGYGTSLVDCPCPRTGMTPLLKAVEVGSGDMARLLLEAGADVRSKATLYDGDDAVALARRLGSRDAIVDMLLAFSSC